MYPITKKYEYYKVYAAYADRTRSDCKIHEIRTGLGDSSGGIGRDFCHI